MLEKKLNHTCRDENKDIFASQERYNDLSLIGAKRIKLEDTFERFVYLCAILKLHLLRGELNKKTFEFQSMVSAFNTASKGLSRCLTVKIIYMSQMSADLRAYLRYSSRTGAKDGESHFEGLFVLSGASIAPLRGQMSVDVVDQS